MGNGVNLRSSYLISDKLAFKIYTEKFPHVRENV